VWLLGGGGKAYLSSTIRNSHAWRSTYLEFNSTTCMMCTQIPLRSNFASRISQKFSEARKLWGKSETSASSINCAMISAAPLIFRTRATASLRLQSNGRGPTPSRDPSAPSPNSMRSPSRNRMNAGPLCGTKGILL
jgi:hypothetical protein